MYTALTSDQLHIEPMTGSPAAELAESWNELAGDVPFRRWEWLEAWWRHYRSDGMELFVLTVRDGGGALIGLAPWYLGRSACAGRVVRFLGSGEVCSDYLTLLAAPGCEEAVGERIAGWLAHEAAGHWDLIELDGVADDDRSVAALAGALKAQGHTLHRRERIGAWRLELPDDWVAYTRRLSKSRRRGVRMLEKRYFETGRAVCKSVERRADLERGLAILRKLHQRRRASLGDPGCFASPRFAGFLAETARRFLARGELRLHWVELDGRPVAVHISFASGDTFYHYQSGMEPDAVHYQPGALIQIAAIKGAIDEGMRAYDFLRGDEPYKALWRAERRPLTELRIVGRHATARLRHCVWLSGTRVRGWLRDAGAAAARHKPAPTPPAGSKQTGSKQTDSLQTDPIPTNHPTLVEP